MASNQPAYAPARPETETAGEWDEFPAEFPREFAAEVAVSASASASASHTPAPSSSALALAPAPARLPRQRGSALGLTLMGEAAGAVALPAAEPVVEPVAVPVVEPLAVPVDVPGSVPEEPAAAEEAAGPADPADPGEALRARIVGQATQALDDAARAEREAGERIAADQAARAAAAMKVREQAAAAKAAVEAEARAEAEAAAAAEAERLARLAVSYIKPLACYTLTTGFGEADPWGNIHAGQDFNAPTGTPVHAVHTGTVASAGWAGAYGYRVVLTLDDGTELWYCHLSTMVATEGRVTTGDTIGRVGATGNVPAPHLHLEVRPGGGDAADPLPWLASHEVTV